MEYPVITYTLKSSELNIERSEVLRYLGYSRIEIDNNVTDMIDPVIEEALKYIRPRACYRRFDINLLGGDRIVLPYGTVTSRHLSINLKGCHGVFFMAATIGAEFDRFMIRSRVSSMAKAAILQAVGATAVEDLCDRLCSKLSDDLNSQNEKTRARYSPGFGDYGLNNQVGLFKALTPEKHTGITLNESLIMSPEKSVTALIGIEKNKNTEK